MKPAPPPLAKQSSSSSVPSARDESPPPRVPRRSPTVSPAFAARLAAMEQKTRVGAPTSPPQVRAEMRRECTHARMRPNAAPN
jgi:hypothetical protein